MKRSTKETINTVIQVLAGLSAAAPVVIHDGGMFAGAGAALAVAAAITRVMAVPAVQDLLARLGLDTR